jgi:hypothetical protein
MLLMVIILQCYSVSDNEFSKAMEYLMPFVN